MGVVELGSISGNVGTERNSAVSGLEDVTLILVDSNGVEANRTITTDSNGDYSFDAVFPGDYILVEVQPDGYADVRENEGGGEADENGTATAVNELFVHVSAGENDASNDFVEESDGIAISGHVYDDGNNDGTVNGTLINNADNVPLFVMLLDDDRDVVQTARVDSNGSYGFGYVDGLREYSDYCLVLSYQEGNDSTSLPVNWNNQDGETNGETVDANADGESCISVEASNIENIDFGINKRPLAFNVERGLQRNPGGNIQVHVIDLNVSDNEDILPHIITIETLPSGGTLYYDGNIVEANQTISDFNNTLLTVNPNNGNVAVVFTYTITDITGWKSESARVRMPFYVLSPTVVSPNIDTEEETATVVVVEEEDNNEPIPSGIINIQDDSVQASTVGPETRISVLSNDQVAAGTEVFLVSTEEGTVLWNEGTAVAGTSSVNTNQIIVEGEGTWEVVDNEIIFTAEDGFTGVPTPIFYVVKGVNGEYSNVAQVSITSNCVCDPYEESLSDSVDIFDAKLIFLIILLSSLFSLFLIRKEER